MSREENLSRASTREPAHSLPLIWQWSMGEINKKQSISVLTSLTLKFHAILPIFILCSVNYDWKLCLSDERACALAIFFTQMPMRTAGGQNEAGDL